MGGPVTQPAASSRGPKTCAALSAPGWISTTDGSRCVDLRGARLIDGAGHWVQQERPREVNAALLEFLGGL